MPKQTHITRKILALFVSSNSFRKRCSCISILHIVAILLIFMGLLAAIAKLSQYKNYKPPNSSPSKTKKFLEEGGRYFGEISKEIKELYPGNFNFFAKSLCKSASGFGSKSETKVLILVASAPANKNQRDAIRNTWAKIETQNLSVSIVVGFVIGWPNNPAFQQALAWENKVNGDIIQADIWDSYLNLTLKSVAMLDWQVQFCKQATYLLKCDDDVYINTNTLQELVHNMQTQEISPDLIFGQEIEDHRPVRKKLSKWFMPSSIYSAHDYPQFCGGPAYMISTQKTQEMLKMALNLNFFPYEDVFITGMVASALGMKCFGIGEFHNSDPLLHMDTPVPCYLKYIVSHHGIAPADRMYILHNLLKSIPESCSESDIMFPGQKN